MDTKSYNNYIHILREELIPALGCTEPIAIAYAAAAIKGALQKMPERISAACSRNIIKNVQGVIVPGTNDLRGVRASVIMGLLCGNEKLKLEVLSKAGPEHAEKAKAMLQTGYCDVSLLDSDENLHIILTASAGDDTALAEVRGTHTGLVRLELNGKSLICINEIVESSTTYETSKDEMSLRSILDFANQFKPEELSDLLDRQIEDNTKIADEGLRASYGANVGTSLLSCRGKDLRTLACAYAAAGSDARMSGCMLPVMINSGSGNQGLTVSLPVIQYAKKLGVSREKLYRALVVSNLVAIYQKHFIGRLSAFCGVVSAACGSGAGIAYLYDSSYDVISKTISNTLANTSGIVCDGAKPACAAKIVSAVNAAIMGFDMAREGNAFSADKGILGSDVEETIRNIGILSCEGMHQTDEVILKIMLKQ